MGNPEMMTMATELLPDWVPVSARRYLLHTEFGLPIRVLARLSGCHASTVLRQVRKFENRRDDILVDEALDCLGRRQFANRDRACKEFPEMTIPLRSDVLPPDDATLHREAPRILRRLCEPGAMLAVAKDMEKAVVVRELPGGKTARTAVVGREIAQAMALKDWIACRSNAGGRGGRIKRYEVTSAGRAALKRMLSAGRASAAGGFSESQAPFGDQHREWGEKAVMEETAKSPRSVRYNVAESPLLALSRRKDRNGKPFLSDELVAAGERLREDFELAQMGPRVAQNWDRFLTPGDRGSFEGGAGPAEGPVAARNRVMAALRDLGPGLGDVVLRCCCFLEGLETAERRMGWSARSGKIVLRIALQRLRRHYEENYGPYGPLIG